MKAHISKIAASFLSTLLVTAVFVGLFALDFQGQGEYRESLFRLVSGAAVCSLAASIVTLFLASRSLLQLVLATQLASMILVALAREILFSL